MLEKGKLSKSAHDKIVAKANRILKRKTKAKKKSGQRLMEEFLFKIKYVKNYFFLTKKLPIFFNFKKCHFLLKNKKKTLSLDTKNVKKKTRKVHSKTLS